MAPLLWALRPHSDSLQRLPFRAAISVGGSRPSSDVAEHRASPSPTYGRLPQHIGRELAARGVRVVVVSTIPEAVRTLAYASFVSVAIDPSAESGIALVKSIKLEESEIAGQQELVLRAGASGTCPS